MTGAVVLSYFVGIAVGAAALSVLQRVAAGRRLIKESGESNDRSNA